MLKLGLAIEAFTDSFMITACSVCNKLTDTSGICRECSLFFEHCLEKEYNFSLCAGEITVKGISCFPYSQNHTRQLILHLKKNKNASTVYYCAKAMEKKLKNLDICGKILFVNIPRSTNGIHKYGFDQGKLLAKAVCELVPGSQYLDIIARKGRSAEQKKLSAAEREQNIKNKFKLKNCRFLKETPKNIVITDDVCTTGSSITECARLLYKNFPQSRIYALTLASNN